MSVNSSTRVYHVFARAFSDMRVCKYVGWISVLIDFRRGNAILFVRCARLEKHLSDIQLLCTLLRFIWSWLRIFFVLECFFFCFDPLNKKIYNDQQSKKQVFVVQKKFISILFIQNKYFFNSAYFQLPVII